jgi:hypothetical protein
MDRSRAAERRCTTKASNLAPLPRVFRAIVRTIVPEGSDLDEASWAELESLVQASLSDRPTVLIRRLRLFLHIVQWLPVLRYGRPFSSLDPDRQALFLTSLQHHRIDTVRVGFWGVRALALLGYYGRSTAQRALGYGADPRGWEAG